MSPIGRLARVYIYPHTRGETLCPGLGRRLLPNRAFLSSPDPIPFDTPPAPRSPLPAHIKTGLHQPWLGSPDVGDRAGCNRPGTPEVYRPTPPRDVAAARWAGLRGVRSGALPKTCMRLIAAWRHGSRPCPSRGRRFSHWASWPPGWLVCGATFWRTLSRRWRLWRLSTVCKAG